MIPSLETNLPIDAAAALAWLIEMGADEIVAEQPIDRFAASAARVTSAAPAPKVITSETPMKREVPVAATGQNAHHIAAQSLSIPALVDGLNQLEGFPLRKSASNLCFIQHHSQGSILVIGDKPGKDEDISGQVMAGKNKILLERMLQAAHVSSQAISIANIIPWRPPGNRNATEAEIQMCLPFVWRAIEILRPKFILTFGQLPANRLLGNNDALMKIRGVWHTLTLPDGTAIPLLPTLHPEFLLKQPGQKKLAWRDLLMFKARVSAENMS